MKYPTLISSRNQALALISATFILTACGGGGDDSPAAAATPATGGASSSTAGTSTAGSQAGAVTPVTRTTPVVVPPAAVSNASQLQIKGAPKTEAEANEAYAFVPTAADSDGDKLSFTIANKPAWLSFAAATGALTGTPTDAQIGVYRNVTIQVAAGGAYETLPAFDIEVVSQGELGITLSWTPPTQNDDGSALSDLAGYKISYGETRGVYTKTVSVTNPGLTTYLIDGLVSSTYYFVIKSYNKGGIESTVSNEATKTI